MTGENGAPNTHHERINFGKYAGELFTRLPVSYLRWMVTNETRDHEMAQAELDRRGIPVTDDGFEISGHAIDTASLRLWAEYIHDRGQDEGLHAWLKRIMAEALKDGEVDEQQRACWRGRVLLCLEVGPIVTVLKTCMIRHKSG